MYEQDYAGRQADLACLPLAALQSIKGVPPCPERYNPANWWVAPLRCAVLSCAVPCRVMPCCVIPAPICAATWWAVCKGPSCMQHSAACPCLTALLHPPPSLCCRMLEVSNPSSEAALDVDFADIYRGSALAK